MIYHLKRVLMPLITLTPSWVEGHKIKRVLNYGISAVVPHQRDIDEYYVGLSEDILATWESGRFFFFLVYLLCLFFVQPTCLYFGDTDCLHTEMPLVGERWPCLEGLGPGFVQLPRKINRLTNFYLFVLFLFFSIYSPITHKSI